MQSPYIQSLTKPVAATVLGLLTTLSARRFLNDAEPVAIYDYPDLYQRAPEELRPKPGEKFDLEKSRKFSEWLVYEDPLRNYKREVVERCALEPARVEEIVTQFGQTISHQPIHDRIAKAGGIYSEEGCAALERDIGSSNPDFRFLAKYDQSWMPGIFCNWYTFYLMRREDPIQFVDPHGTTNPIGLFLGQNYELVREPGEWDVVMYGNLEEKDGMRNFHSRHFGVCRRDPITHQMGVVSKTTSGNVAWHTFEAGDSPGNSYLLFRKPMDLSRPIADMDRIVDWGMVDELFVDRVSNHQPSFWAEGAIASGAISGSLALMTLFPRRRNQQQS